MEIQINGSHETIKPGANIAIFKEMVPGADLIIVNGAIVTWSYNLCDGDSCYLIKKGEAIRAEDMENILYLRHSPGVQDIIKNSVVGVMGLGGLGSLVATALARLGVGKLILADFDIVDPTNLNRQNYFFDQIGMLKTEATALNIKRINPFVELSLYDEKLEVSNIPKVFADCQVLVECFDGPEMKALAYRLALTTLRPMGYVGASGMAGFGDNNLITTRCLRDNIYLVGDFASEAKPGQGLMAPRVGIAAHHQANQALRILLADKLVD